MSFIILNYFIFRMIQVTKIFRFEMAHAITGYDGPCKHIHGHSYVLHVTATEKNGKDNYMAAPGFVIDFKDLKSIVNKSVIDQLDHKLVLSKAFLLKHLHAKQFENLVVWDMEPSAENMLIYISREIQKKLPENVILKYLKLYETNNSYAEWINTN